jgi:hypothetical protein
MLKIMDFVGNWGYGIRLPDRYFTRQSFAKACVSSGLTVKEIFTGINLYSHLPFLKWLLRPDWQFIALLEPNE